MRCWPSPSCRSPRCSSPGRRARLRFRFRRMCHAPVAARPAAAAIMQMPMAGEISSPYGRRKDPKAGVPAFHNGIDIAAPVGTTVMAPANGRVEAIYGQRQRRQGRGNRIRRRPVDPDDPSGGRQGEMGRPRHRRAGGRAVRQYRREHRAASAFRSPPAWQDDRSGKRAAGARPADTVIRLPQRANRVTAD